LPVFGLLLLAGLLGVGVPASAHAFIDTADPAVGSTIKVAPTVVTLTFSEALEPHFSSIAVVDAAGQRVDLDDAHVAQGDATRFMIGLKPLKPGTYTVNWRATSVDTHKTNGNYHFTVTP